MFQVTICEQPFQILKVVTALPMRFLPVYASSISVFFAPVGAFTDESFILAGSGDVASSARVWGMLGECMHCLFWTHATEV